MSAVRKPHVFYIGDWVFLVGPTFTESPFHHEAKDTDLHFYGQRLADALSPKAEMTCMSSWQLYRLPPGQFEKLMRESAAADHQRRRGAMLRSVPRFLRPRQREGRVVTFPDASRT